MTVAPAEFVHRRPRDRAEALAVMGAAAQDPYGGYACDGDAHRTPELVRDWWRERGAVREWAVRLDRVWSVSRRPEEREAACAARAYVAHIDGDLADHLRGCRFRLREGRGPRPGGEPAGAVRGKAGAQASRPMAKAASRSCWE